MVSFDDVLGKVVEICELHPDFTSVSKAVAVRDLEGRVRLVLRIDTPATPPLDVDALEAALSTALGKWFQSRILVKGPTAPATRTDREIGALAAQVLDRSEAWPQAAYIDTLTGQRVQAARWFKIEARLSKQAWTDPSQVTLPWPLRQGTPAIATFYSFKGGVGRTTLLAAMAWRLARLGKRVVVVDLDVEAPGAGTLFGASAQRGLLDLLLDHASLGDFDLDAALSPASALDPASQPLVEVIGAGALSEGYFEKLARLDYTASGVLPASTGDSPVGAALKALLHKLIRRTPRPDYILFDARAGLHDVAGLSLHGLAHVDVLVARASDQAYQGLDLAIASLARRRKPRDLRLLVAHTFVPPVPGSPEAVAVEREFADRAYDIFQRHVHPTMNPAHIPAPEGDGAHKPALVRALEVLARPSRLLDLQSTLLGDAFADAFDRFDVLCKPEPESEVP